MALLRDAWWRAEGFGRVWHALRIDEHHKVLDGIKWQLGFAAARLYDDAGVPSAASPPSGYKSQKCNGPDTTRLYIHVCGLASRHGLGVGRFATATWFMVAFPLGSVRSVYSRTVMHLPYVRFLSIAEFALRGPL